MHLPNSITFISTKQYFTSTTVESFPQVKIFQHLINQKVVFFFLLTFCWSSTIIKWTKKLLELLTNGYKMWKSKVIVIIISTLPYIIPINCKYQEQLFFTDLVSGMKKKYIKKTFSFVNFSHFNSIFKLKMILVPFCILFRKLIFSFFFLVSGSFILFFFSVPEQVFYVFFHQLSNKIWINLLEF